MGVKAIRIGNSQASDAIFPGTTQVIAISSGAASTASAAFGSSTELVRVACTSQCFISFGASPTATNSTSLVLPAGAVEYFAVTPGEKVAMLAGTVAGIFTITEAVSN